MRFQPKMSAEGLRRGLGRLEVVALTLNTIVGAGIFAMPATLAASAGSASLPVLLAAFALVALMALACVEVASRFDTSGGPMQYAGAAFGRHVGFGVGWLMFVSRVASVGAIATVMLDYAAGLAPALGTPAVRGAAAVAFFALVAGINLRGVGSGALLSNLLTLAKGLPLVALAVAGVALAGWNDAPVTPPAGREALSKAFMLAFFACMGFEQATVVSGEVRDPRRDLAKGILAGVAIVGALYSALLFACFALVPDLAASKRPLAEAAAALVGPAGARFMMVAAVFSCAGGISASMLATPRVLFAMGVQGDLPAAVARVAPGSQVPAAAIAVTATIIAALTVSGTFVYLATLAVVARMIMYSSACLALIVLRRREGPAPLRVRGGPLWALLSVAACAVALATTTRVSLVTAGIALLAGFAVRTLARRRGA